MKAGLLQASITWRGVPRGVRSRDEEHLTSSTARLSGTALKRFWPRARALVQTLQLIHISPSAAGFLSAMAPAPAKEHLRTSDGVL